MQRRLVLLRHFCRLWLLVVLLLGVAGCRRDVTDVERQTLEELHRAVALMEAIIQSLPKPEEPEEGEKKEKKAASEFEKVATRAWEQLVLARNEYGAALLADTAGDSEMAELLIDSVRLALKAALVEMKSLRRSLKELEPSPIALLSMLDEVEKIAKGVLEEL